MVLNNDYCMRKNLYYILAIVIILFCLGVYLWSKSVARQSVVINSFEECITFGGLVAESYPRQCRFEGKVFVENIGNELEKSNLIKVTSPRPNQTIKSPLTITGEARGYWFFEASFPLVLTNWDGLIIAEGYAQAKSEWMTTEFVPFEATLTFVADKKTDSNKGTLILKKDNSSGLPEHDDALQIPVIISVE